LKGQISLGPMAIASMFITLLLLGITLGTQTLTNDFIKGETMGLQVDRIVNGVISLESLSKGSIQMEMSKYSIKVEDGNISMNYSNSNISRSLDDEPVTLPVTGPSSFENIDKNICIRKKSSEIKVEVGDC